MANIMDYLVWRGDLDWDASPFNEVDNVILSELVYVDFSDIVPQVGEGSITLFEANERFFAQHTEEEINARVSSTKMAAFMMREMVKTKRFKDILLADYVDDIRQDEQSQFCAMTVDLGDGRCNVVYSGTDSTIVGWKEDFNMSFLSETPGQAEAVEYLKRVAADHDGPLRLMGHSKGGNLSVYAAVNSDKALQDRIEIIYSNDGPGFRDTMIEQKAYRELIGRITTIVPESSIVGMLFEHEEEYEIVRSSGSGAGQHDVMSWEVKGSALVHLDHVDGKSVLMDKALKSWIGEMDEQQREVFVDTLFGILDEADIRTVDDLANMNYPKFVELMKAKSALDKQTQDNLRDTLMKLVQKSAKTVAEHLFSR